MRNILLFAVLIFFVFGCTSHEEKKIEEQNKQQQELEKDIIISNLVTKYSIAYKWDTLKYYYSINYRNVIESKNQLIEFVNITDIYTKDSSEYVSLQTGFFPSFNFDFPITKEQESKLLNIDDDLILVVSISEIRKIKFELEGEIEDGVSTTINLTNSIDFIGKGEIIEIVSTNK